MIPNEPGSLRVAGIHKSFPGVQALDDVNLEVKSGEIHALVGENGAGKSTLIKILMGVYQKDAGEIYIDGVEAHIHSPVEAARHGLHAVYQDLVIAPELSVGENFFIGNLPMRAPGVVNWKGVYRQAGEKLKALGINVDPRRKILDLSPGEQSMVTIAKIVQGQARFMIFDEPTARLTTDETRQLFELIQRLKQNNLGIIYISHRMEEIFEICDSVTVLRDGRVVGSEQISQVTEGRLISMMVGRTIEEMYNIRRGQAGEVLLEVRGLTSAPHFKDVSFTLRQGEVLGLFGLVGAGRTNLLRAIFGANRVDRGQVVLQGKTCLIREPHQAILAGIGLVPEDRKTQGLAMPLSVSHNMNITSYKDISSAGVVHRRQERSRTEKMVQELSIRTPSVRQIVEHLSGGNQQKVAIAKWLCRDADILLMDEPTTGVDVGAKVEIYALIEGLIQRRKAVILCSSYLPEVIGLSDRILVMAEGNVTGEVTRQDANEELLLTLASRLSENGTAAKPE